MTYKARQNSRLPAFDHLEPRLMMSGTPLLGSLVESAGQIDVPAYGSVGTADRITGAGENNLYEFTTKSRGWFTVEMAVDGSDIDSYLELYNSSGRRIRWNNDASQETADSRIRLYVRPGQTFYALASGYNDTSGAYTLTFTASPFDDLGNTFETAKTLLLNESGGGSIYGRINYTGDADVLSVLATHDGTMQVGMSAWGWRNKLDCELFAYDAGGNLLNHNDNNGDDTDSLLHFDVDEGQLYYIKMAGADDNTGVHQLNIATDQRIVPVVAADDAAITDEDATTIINVLANDTALDGATLAIAGFTQAANGTVGLNGDGMLTYSPTADYNGEDVFTYTVTDGNGGEATATVNVTVNPVNDAPTASIGSDVTGGLAALLVNFDGFQSSDLDGDTLTYQWDFGDGNTATGVNVSHTYQTPGDYTASLTVNDGNGGSDAATTGISVAEAPNDQPGWDDWSDWTKNSGPVFSGQYGIASDPSVIYDADAGVYRMFNTGLDVINLRTIICEAVSTDGISWEYVTTDGLHHGVVLSGTSGQWDENLESADVLKEADRTILYYAGYRDEGYPIKGFPAALGAATSTDGVTFERVSDAPILEPTSGWYDNDAIYSPSVIKHDGQYVMVYVGHCYTNYENIDAPGVYILGATSPDGINWTKHAEPLLGPNSEIDWMSWGAAEPSLLAGPDGKFYMFFTGLEQEQRVIGVACSDSPLGEWEVLSDPIITPAAGSFDGHQVLAPTVMYENGTLRMWYLGVDGEQHMVTGYAEATWEV